MVPAYAHPIMLGTLKFIKNYSKLSAEVIVVLNFVVVLFCFFQNKTLSSNGVLLGILICEAVESGISPNGVKEEHGPPRTTAQAGSACPEV